MISNSILQLKVVSVSFIVYLSLVRLSCLVCFARNQNQPNEWTNSLTSNEQVNRDTASLESQWKLQSFTNDQADDPAKSVPCLSWSTSGDCLLEGTQSETLLRADSQPAEQRISYGHNSARDCIPVATDSPDHVICIPTLSSTSSALPHQSESVANGPNSPYVRFHNRFIESTSNDLLGPKSYPNTDEANFYDKITRLRNHNDMQELNNRRIECKSSPADGSAGYLECRWSKVGQIGLDSNRYSWPQQERISRGQRGGKPFRVSAKEAKRLLDSQAWLSAILAPADTQVGIQNHNQFVSGDQRMFAMPTLGRIPAAGAPQVLGGKSRSQRSESLANDDHSPTNGTSDGVQVTELVSRASVDTDGQSNAELESQLECRTRRFTFRAVKTDASGEKCSGLVEASICYGGCDTGEIADWVFPHKKSIHKVCTHGSRIRRRAILTECSSNSVPESLREYHYVDARTCVCQKCTSIDTTCLDSMTRPYLSSSLAPESSADSTGLAY